MEIKRLEEIISKQYLSQLFEKELEPSSKPFTEQEILKEQTRIVIDYNAHLVAQAIHAEHQKETQKLFDEMIELKKDKKDLMSNLDGMREVHQKEICTKDMEIASWKTQVLEMEAEIARLKKIEAISELQSGSLKVIEKDYNAHLLGIEKIAKGEI